MFEMPALLNELPEGTVIWNAGAEETNNFGLAGKRLTNRVLTRPWSGAQVALDFIQQEGVDFIVEIHPFCCDELEEIGARRVFEGKVGPTHRWRVWAVP